ncbi:hypothetical protein DAEQUDRAFT_717977 [Daedalea quercina L-15889]|uniref:Uncharacterized protein n=1 Tax=Daedalea quercina L-15889 TaxID=1314783 RepID=A0A165LJI9_9APHY|nr:hypothetical protein DAEQUDRAFT_717977 [Daedalea quercina L-15889]
MPLRMYLAQYSRHGDTAKEPKDYLPRHWVIAIRFSKPEGGKSTGTVLHVKGVTGGQWEFERINDDVYARSPAWAGCIFLGTIDASNVDKLERLLATIPLQHGHATWNSQNWAWDALKLMRQQGYNVQLPASKSVMDEMMIKAKSVDWEHADDSN